MKKTKTAAAISASIPHSRKAVWITEKLHKKIKLLAVQRNISMLSIIEESMDLWAAKNKTKI